MYSIILFDMDDTLFDFQKAQEVSIKNTLIKNNIVYSDSIYECYKKINHNLWIQFDQGKITKDYVQTERFYQLSKRLNQEFDCERINYDYQINLAKQTWLIRDAKKICIELSKRYSLFIATNGVGSTQKNRFYNSQIFPYFKDIFISEDIGFSKPNIEFFNAVFQKIDYSSKKDILLVGDSLTSDICGANKAGIDCCWYNPYGANPTNKYRMTYMISELRQLLAIL